MEKVLQEANIRWFVTDTHGLLHARPRPRYGVYAPVFTPGGVAAFGRDFESAKQVWSKQEGYPGDFRYRDFYRDIGFDLDFDYVKPYLPAPDTRGFTGIKYHRITGPTPDKQVYDRAAALRAARGACRPFSQARNGAIRQARRCDGSPAHCDRALRCRIIRPLVARRPGVFEFLRALAACDGRQAFQLATPGEFLRAHSTHQVAMPAASSWGEEGYWRVWLDESNQWIYPHLRAAQARMAKMAQDFPSAAGLMERALQQAARELLLAQSSDWPFILHTGTSPDYAAARVKEHLRCFLALHDQICRRKIDPALALRPGVDRQHLPQRQL